MKPIIHTINFILILFIVFPVSAQQSDLVRWKFKFQPTGDKTGEIQLTANVIKPWHIYSQEQPKDAVALPTRIKFNPNPIIVIKGKVKEIGKREKFHNQDVGITQYQYGDQVIFVQSVSLKTKIKTNISGTVSFQLCNDQKCLPMKTVSFNIPLN